MKLLLWKRKVSHDEIWDNDIVSGNVDMDYMIQRTLHNCFTGDTEFITDEGLRRFDSFESGERIAVQDKFGEWRVVTVHSFGKQKIQAVALQSGQKVRFKYCTPNHRWVLEDNSVTVELKEGDVLYKPRESKDRWEVIKIIPLGREELVWCVEEPVTHTFRLKDDIVTGNCELINLNDMLQNGTVINKVRIDKPRRLITASTIATQAILSVTSSSYGI